MIKKFSFIEGVYEGHNNEEIITLRKNYNEIILNLKLIEQRIRKIQDNCEHTYQFECNTGYNTYYVCNKCGSEFEQ